MFMVPHTRQVLHLLLAALLAFTLADATAVAKDAYRPPRVADGRPDLQGYWDHTDCTPLERPPRIATLVITKEQAAQIERSVELVLEDRATPTEPTEFLNQRRIQPIHGELHSSIVVVPENGRLPGTPLFNQWIAKARAGVLNAMDGPEQRPASERCLGNPAAQAPNLYNPGTNLHQIVQTRDTVVFVSEFIGEARIIRLNSNHRAAAIKSWSGDSIGWWEGDTLVVETKYFSPSDPGRFAAGMFYMISPDATVIERITRVSTNELHYVFTVDDPAYYTQIWKGETHFMRTDDRLLEYACHEANDSLAIILKGARVREGAWPPKTFSGGQP
ncbi:MAG TPA: hypothetical protein VET48_00595 [Steroidobacteraceae bacterium]|nr:hypothetical protein [Steroidobacteraceae bacterium]